MTVNLCKAYLGMSFLSKPHRMWKIQCFAFYNTVVCYSFSYVCSFIVLGSYVIFGLGQIEMAKCFHAVIYSEGEESKNPLALSGWY